MYICEQTAKRITVYDLATKTIVAYYRFPNEVTGAAVSKDGGRLYVTCGSEMWPAGMVCVVNTATGVIERQVSEGIGSMPRSPVLHPTAPKLYICNMFSNNLSVIDIASLTVTKRVELVREPYCAAVTPDGTRLVIGNSLPNDRSTDSLRVSCEITVMDAVTDICNPETDHIRLTRGSHSVFGLAISPDGKYAFASHLIGKFNLLGSTVTGGWLHTNNVAVINIATKKFVNDVALDYGNEGRANPWDIKFTDQGMPNDTFMIVAHAGSNHLSMIKYNKFIDTVLDNTSAGVDMGQKFTYLLDDIRKCVDITTKGTRACAVIGNKVFAAGYYDDEKGVMEEHMITLKKGRLDTAGTFICHNIAAPADLQKQTGERRGEQNYYDADLCFQQWQSCHSCHPLARPDGLNWILNSGATGTPKNAKTMVYAWWTKPTTWNSKREDAGVSVRAGIQLELFQNPSPDMAAPMDTFMMYLKPMMSPFLVKGKLSPSALRGRALYYDSTKVDCITCHKGPLFYDEKLYDCGVADIFDASQVNTPHLAEQWRMAPYGHLGTYTGMREIFEIDKHSDMKEKLTAGKLTVDDVTDLVEYVNSL